MLHLCYDEVSVDQTISALPHSEGYELAGFANRIARTSTPDSVQYIITRGSEEQPGQLVVLEGSGDTLSRTEHGVERLQQITHSVPRATCLAFFLGCVPVRGSPVLVLSAIPTRNDMTVADDAIFVEGITQQLRAAGLPSAAFIGADGAHACQVAGMQRAWTNSEQAYCSALQLEPDAPIADLMQALVDTCRPIGVLRSALQLLHAGHDLMEVSTFQCKVPYVGMPYAASFSSSSSCFVSTSHEWRHSIRLMVRCSVCSTSWRWVHCIQCASQATMRFGMCHTMAFKYMRNRSWRYPCASVSFHAWSLQVSHVRDKQHKLPLLDLRSSAGPALLTDLLLLHRKLGPVQSGIGGNLIDRTDSSQNNKRAEELGNLDLVQRLLQAIPGSHGTAVFVLVSGAYLAAFRDHADAPPMCPQARLVHLAFVQGMLVVNALALTSRMHGLPAMSIKVHGLTSQTRSALLGSLPSMCAMLQQQARTAAATGIVPPLVPEESGSTHCEELYSQLRGGAMQQNTSNISAGAAALSRHSKAATLSCHSKARSPSSW